MLSLSSSERSIKAEPSGDEMSDKYSSRSSSTYSRMPGGSDSVPHHQYSNAKYRGGGGGRRHVSFSHSISIK